MNKMANDGDDDGPYSMLECLFYSMMKLQKALWERCKVQGERLSWYPTRHDF
jgi:hypothetical protein